MYINCKTYYSLRYGTFSTRGLIDAAAEQGISCLALTNINGTYDAWDFVQQCREAGIKPILGMELRPTDALQCILLAANNQGLAAIHRFASAALLQKQLPDKTGADAIFDQPEDGFIIYPLGAKDPAALLPNERIGVAHWELNKLYSMPWRQYPQAFVIRQPVTVAGKKEYNLHRLLRAINKNVLLSNCLLYTSPSPRD